MALGKGMDPRSTEKAAGKRTRRAEDRAAKREVHDVEPTEAELTRREFRMREWQTLCRRGHEPANLDAFLGLTRQECDAWLKSRPRRIVIGYDTDDCEPQRTHAVLGAGHFDKRPLCGADTLWGCDEGTVDRVTCPACKRAPGDWR